MDRARGEIEAAGASLVFIGQLSPRHAAQFKCRQELSSPVLADEQRASYKAAGAKIATLRELVGPKMLAKGTSLSARTGLRQTRTLGHPAQLGGAMAISPDGEVAWSHMAEDASDNATPDEVLAAIHAL